MKIEIPYYLDSSRISNSALGWFKKSPKYYRDRLDGKIPGESSKAMENGTAVHMYILQPEEFKKEYKVLNFESPSSPNQKKFCLDYINSKATTAKLKALEAFKSNYSATGKKDDEMALKGLEIALKLKDYIKWIRYSNGNVKTLTWSELNSLKLIKESVLLHKKAKELLLTNDNSESKVSFSEFHINWEFVTENKIKLNCKSLIDRIKIDHEAKTVYLIDIKTTGSISDFKKSFNEYDYGRQMAFYWYAICWYFDNVLKIDISEYKQSTYIVAIESRNKEVKVLEVPESILIEKSKEIKSIISQIEWHEKHNLWEFSKEYYENDGVETSLYEV
jgi:hypothetical protein